jgi:hypothetical protein
MHSEVEFTSLDYFSMVILTVKNTNLLTVLSDVVIIFFLRINNLQVQSILCLFSCKYYL